MNNIIDEREKLNVCLLNDSFPPVIDGVANTVFNYATIIQNELGNAVVATPEYPNVTDSYKFDVVRYKSFDTTGIIGYRAGYPFEPATIGRVEDKNINIIHSHCPAVSTVLARTLREKVNVPIVFTYHTKFDIDIKKAIESNLLQEAMIKFIVKNVEACDEVWVVSRGAGENLKSLGYKGDYIVMENGVDFTKGKADNDKVIQLKKELGIDDGYPTFLFVGRLMWYKGLKLIFNALKTVKEHGGKFHMVVVGNGADGKEMEEYTKQIGIDDCCVFAGAVHERETLRVYYTMADMFLFASTYDTNGIVVREAAACGLGSVLIKGSCAAENIVHERNGYIIDETEDAMAEAITKLINNIGLAHEIGENAMNEIYIPWDASVKKAYDRYYEVIKNYRNPHYIPKYSFTDDALSGIGGICEGLFKAEKMREVVSNGFMESNYLKAKEVFEKHKEMGQGFFIENPKKKLLLRTEQFKTDFSEKKNELKSEFVERRDEAKEIIWHYMDRYL